MPNERQASLCTLPVELIFHVFRHLDATTLVRSFRRVCQRFYTLVNAYEQFQLDFQSILKSDFHFLCNFIPADHVVSLILSDGDETPGQIEYFLSTFRIRQYTQLRSLTVLNVSGDHLGVILRDVKELSLQSLSVQTEEQGSSAAFDSVEISSDLALCDFDKLRLDIRYFDISAINWPLDSKLSHLEVRCQTVNEYCHIFLRLPHLRVLVVDRFDESDFELTTVQLSTMVPCCRLASLTFKHCGLTMTILETLLALAPGLKHLRLIRSMDVSHFILHLSRWEQFIRAKLPSLTQFEFFLTEDSLFTNTPIDTELLVAPFRASFWAETMHCLTACDYIVRPRTVILYTPPIFDPRMEYVYESKQIYHSSSAATAGNIAVMNGVRRMRLNLSRVMSLATSSHVRSGFLPRIDDDCSVLRVACREIEYFHE